MAANIPQRPDGSGAAAARPAAGRRARGVPRPSGPLQWPQCDASASPSHASPTASSAANASGCRSTARRWPRTRPRRVASSPPGTTSTTSPAALRPDGVLIEWQDDLDRAVRETERVLAAARRRRRLRGRVPPSQRLRARRHPRAPRRPLPHDRGEVGDAAQGVPPQRRRRADLGPRGRRPAARHARRRRDRSRVRLPGRRGLPGLLQADTGRRPGQADPGAHPRLGEGLRRAPQRAGAGDRHGEAVPQALRLPVPALLRGTRGAAGGRRGRAGRRRRRRPTPPSAASTRPPPAYLASLPYPRFYLDFETAQFAVPVWPGTRPFEQLPFQWSCHVEPAFGVVEHAEFLDTTGDAPMRAAIEALLATLGERGPGVRLHRLREVAPASSSRRASPTSRRPSRA